MTDPCDDITQQERFHEWILRKIKEERENEKSNNRHRDGESNTK